MLPLFSFRINPKLFGINLRPFGFDSGGQSLAHLAWDEAEKATTLTIENPGSEPFRKLKF